MELHESVPTPCRLSSLPHRLATSQSHSNLLLVLEQKWTKEGGMRERSTGMDLTPRDVEMRARIEMTRTQVDPADDEHASILVEGHGCDGCNHVAEWG